MPEPGPTQRGFGPCRGRETQNTSKGAGRRLDAFHSSLLRNRQTKVESFEGCGLFSIDPDVNRHHRWANIDRNWTLKFDDRSVAAGREQNKKEYLLQLHRR